MSTLLKTPTRDAVKTDTPPRILAAKALQNLLTLGKRIDRRTLSKTMTKIYGGTDAENCWSWKDAYDAAECAEIIHLRDNFKNKLTQLDEDTLKTLEDLQALQPAQTLRSETQNLRQQFSTPISLAYLAASVASITKYDTVLEPSAGHGNLAVFAKLAGATLMLNEIDRKRSDACSEIFSQTVYTEDASYLNDVLPTPTRPSLVIMNPPFSSSLKRGKNRIEMAVHIMQALQRLSPGGRLVAIVGYNFHPEAPSYAKAWERILEIATLTASIGLAKGIFKSKGTSFATRLVVIDKGVQEETVVADAQTMTDVLNAIKTVPSRLGSKTTTTTALKKPARKKTTRAKGPLFTLTKKLGKPVEYTEITASASTAKPDSLYVAYSPQRIKIKGAKEHPSQLTQSVGLASIIPPMPTYQPKLPEKLVTEGHLSDAQLETIIYAGEAHSRHLKGSFVYDAEQNEMFLAKDGEDGVRIRKGYMIGDGTGLGKGREIAGIILDNWINGRRKAIWISKSSNLINDARRDLIDLGFAPNEIFAQNDFEYGTPITRTEGVIFSTFALIRGQAKDDRQTRLDQLIEWAGADFDGVIGLDEGHALANAVTSHTDRGEKSTSLQGQAGLKLQFVLNDARIVYSSATSATTIENLGYMDRLGLWRGTDAPFATRSAFMASIISGGVAALELITRDLKAMGLYLARNISFEGVEYSTLTHELSADQINIYNQFADAFQIIHKNLEAALEAINVKEDGTTKNSGAVGAARSAFESTKQRFFNHLLTSMKMPTILKQMTEDLESGHAVIAQIVSTGEAILSRRLATVAPSEIIEGNVDMTPKDSILEYVENSFPTQLFEIVVDSSGTERAEPVFDLDGHPVRSQEAMERRQHVMESLCALPSIPSALDQLIWHFGPDKVAEVTGRSKRIIKRKSFGTEIVEIQSRPASSNRSELNALMDGKKDILIFSRSGATGFSMHSDLRRKNQKRRVQYVVEAGWSADSAVQGLGRSHRSNQACPPLFRPCSTNVQGEKRFLSTIARRLNSLGALTKGERKTGGQNLFRPEDNLESEQAIEALQIFFRRLHAEPQGGITLGTFQDMTGLSLTAEDGTLKDTLPTIQRFLNRLLALRIEDQNVLFDVFMEIIDNRVEAAREAGTLDVGAEEIKAEKIEILSDNVLRVDPVNGAETKLLQIRRHTKIQPITLKHIADYRKTEHDFVYNEKTDEIAIVTPTNGYTETDTGRVIKRVRITTPKETYRMGLRRYMGMAFEPVSPAEFENKWDKQIDNMPKMTVDEFGIVTGLIMPLWETLKDQRQTVYRIDIQDKGTILGRYIPPGLIENLLNVYNVKGESTLTSPEAVISSVLAGEKYSISSECFITKSRVMDMDRLELKNYTYSWLEHLKSIGCFAEIIRYNTRVFIPNDETATKIIGEIQSAYITI